MGAEKMGLPVTARSLMVFFAPIALFAQELQPRAYFPAPVGMNFLSISYSYNSGGLLFDPSLPVENGEVKAGIPSIALGSTLAVFGRTGQVLAVLPYVTANVSGTIMGIPAVPASLGIGRFDVPFCHEHPWRAGHAPEGIRGISSGHRYWR